MGFRNAQAVSALASQGRLNNARGHIKSFSSDEYAILITLALCTADYPLDIDAQRKNLLPRTYMHGWRELSKMLGMTLPDDLTNVSIVGNESHDFKKEETARIRVGRIMKKLQSKGLVKCLKDGRYTKHNSAVWFLTIGTPSENAACEKYIKMHLPLAPSKPESTPSITQTVTQAASAASLLPRPPAIITADDSPTSPTPPTVEEEQQDDTLKEKPQAPVRHFIGFRNQT